MFTVSCMPLPPENRIHISMATRGKIEIPWSWKGITKVQGEVPGSVIKPNLGPLTQAQ